MTFDLTQLVICLAIGAIIGTIAVKFAPAACKRFHLFSVGKRSIPLHLFSLVFFGACGIMGIREQNYLMVAFGTGLAILAILALGVVLGNKNKNLTHDVAEHQN
jgi:hypothetical protein